MILVEATLAKLHTIEVAQIATCEALAAGATAMGDAPHAAAFHHAAFMATLAIVAIDTAIAGVVAAKAVQVDALAVITAAAIEVAAASAYEIGTDVAEGTGEAA